MRHDPTSPAHAQMKRLFAEASVDQWLKLNAAKDAADAAYMEARNAAWRLHLGYRAGDEAGYAAFEAVMTPAIISIAD